MNNTLEKKYLDILLEHMIEGVVIHDNTGKIIFFNDKALEILGLTSDQVLGKSNMDPQWKTIHEDGSTFKNEDHPSWVATITGKCQKNCILGVSRKKNEIRWLSINAIPIFNSEDIKPHQVIVTLQDFTQEKEIEHKIKIAAKLSSLGEMCAGIAHEINNPLAIIKGKVGIIAKQLKNENLQDLSINKHVTTVLKTVERITKIIAGLKVLSRNGVRDQFVDCDLNEVVEEIILVSEDRLKNHNIKLEVEYLEHKNFLNCSPTQIGQVLINILNNSIDAIKILKERWIKIEMTLDNSHYIFRITDSGPGIEYEIQEKIFSPFFTTKEIGQGTGLGLSISNSIIQDHNGEFSIDSKSANTCFIIKLPRISSEIKKAG